MKVEVSPRNMTCGEQGTARYCLQTGGYYRECDFCDATNASLHHNPEYLTDIQTDEQEQTSWQSVTMDQNVHMGLVNLTVNLSELCTKPW